MATRRKTIEYWFPELAAVSDNTDTAFTAITAYIPETGSTFRSVYMEVIIQDAEATSNNVNRRQISLKIGDGAYTDINNTNLFTSSGEQKWIMASGDFTTLFTNAWTGTTQSATLTAKCLFDSAIATPAQAWRCATAKLVITYDYDDTQDNQIKTIWIPLITPITSLGTTKPAAIDTIPALDTFCPETGKTYRQVTIVVQGNEESAATADKSLSWSIDNEAVYTTGIHEGALNTSCWFRHSQNQTTGSLWTGTSTTHSWYIWASAAAFAHVQAWIVVTYEFHKNSNTILNSMQLPMYYDSPAGGVTNADYQRASRNISVQEPETITLQRSSIQFFWDQQAPVFGIQYRVNAGAWSGAIASTGTTIAGSCCAQYICDSYIGSLSRGRNEIYADIYRVDTADLMYNLSALWIINYKSGRHPDGAGAHNHTVRHSFDVFGTGAAAQEVTTATKSYTLPETNYYITGIGTEYIYQTNTTGNPQAIMVQAERLAAEGGLKWEPIYIDASTTDALTGQRYTYSQARELYYRWPNDPDPERIKIEIARRYKTAFSPALGWRQLTFLTTYHTITCTVSGNINNSNGGEVKLFLKRSDLSTFNPGSLLVTGSTTGNTTYSLTWYDDTTSLYVAAYESESYKGMSKIGTPSNDFDISLYGSPHYAFTG